MLVPPGNALDLEGGHNIEGFAEVKETFIQTLAFSGLGKKLESLLS